MCVHLICDNGMPLELCNICVPTRRPDEKPHLRLVDEMTPAEDKEFRWDLVRGEGWKNN